MVWPYCEFRKQVWNVLHAARCKCRTQKNRQKFAIWAPSHNFVGRYLRNWGMYRQSEKLVKQQCLPHMSSQYGELRPTSGWDLLAGLGHPSKLQRVSRLGRVTARHSSSGRQPLWHWTEAATYIRQGGHHVGHWTTFLVYFYSFSSSSTVIMTYYDIF